MGGKRGFTVPRLPQPLGALLMFVQELPVALHWCTCHGEASRGVASVDVPVGAL